MSYSNIFREITNNSYDILDKTELGRLGGQSDQFNPTAQRHYPVSEVLEMPATVRTSCVLTD